jgi:hypothetical protein
MCISNFEYQRVNPTTQVALFALCLGNCTTIENIQWNIYQGLINSSSNYTQWNFFNQTNSYENNWFFGGNTSHFTALNQLFLSNPQINFWKFEVIYTFISETSSSALNFIINQPPSNGSCSINPLNGTTSTLFDISCPDWFDEEGIKDYSLYGREIFLSNLKTDFIQLAWTSDPSERMIIAFSSISTFQVLLPAGDDQTSLLHLTISIRDTLYCLTELNISSVNVIPDSAGISNLINSLQNSTNNPIVQLLASGNQNIVGQVITSLSQAFNQMNSKSIDQAVSSKDEVFDHRK